jgi:SAM-dependent methyltransferase
VDEREDAYGRLIRDDGFVFAYHSDYLIEPFWRWQPVERRAQRFVRGRVLDIGCGAGRVCLHLQERGLDVVGVDNSPSAVEGCRRRGVKDVRLCAIDGVDERLGSFDTLVMLGNNFGLIGGEASARRALRAMHAVTRPGGRLLGQSFDPQGDPGQWGYATRNARRGRFPGTQRVRVRYRDFATPWFDHTLFSPDEMAKLLEETGWRLRRTLPGRGAGYLAIIDRR